MSLVADNTIALAYQLTPDSIGEILSPMSGSLFDTPAAYKAGIKAIATCRELRSAIEARRKELKADSLEFGRRVDDVAKRLTQIVEGVELPLKEARRLVDDAREQAKREAALAETRRVEAEIQAKREAEEAHLREVRRAEELHLASQRAALEEAKREHEKERLALEASRQDTQRQLAELREQRRAANEAQEKARRDEQHRLDVERAAAAKEEARLNALEYERVRQARIAALAPDREKLGKLADSVVACLHTSDLAFESPEARAERDAFAWVVETAAKKLKGWAP